MCNLGGEADVPCKELSKALVVHHSEVQSGVLPRFVGSENAQHNVVYSAPNLFDHNGGETNIASLSTLRSTTKITFEFLASLGVGSNGLGGLGRRAPLNDEQPSVHDKGGTKGSP